MNSAITMASTRKPWIGWGIDCGLFPEPRDRPVYVFKDTGLSLWPLRARVAQSLTGREVISMREHAAGRGLMRLILINFLCCFAILQVPAAPIDAGAIPPTLKEWTAWVLYGEETKTCPFTYSRFEDHHCAWPTELKLRLGADGGAFSQAWQVHAETWISLPGDHMHWPQNVTVDSRAASLIQRNGRPQLRLDKGRHAIAGAFEWNKLPESLAIPRDTGLVTLEVAGSTVSVTDIDDAGNLWLMDRVSAGGEVAGDQIKLLVFRRVIDEIPLQVVTRIELEVSGAQREESMIGALPDQFIALRLD